MSRPLLYFVLIALTIESGLQSRTFVKNLQRSFTSVSQNSLDLFYGDSVTGDTPISFARQLPGVKVISHSAFTSWEVSDRVEEDIRNFRPKKIFLLIGLGDYKSGPVFKKKTLSLKSIDVIKKTWKNLFDHPLVSYFVVKIFPDSPDHLYKLAWYENGADNFVAAIPYFQRALKIRPNYPKAIDVLARCHLEAKSYKQGLEFFEQLEVYPETEAWIQKYKSVFKTLLGQSQNTNLLDLQPSAQPGYLGMLWKLVYQGKIAAAEKLYKAPPKDFHIPILDVTLNNILTIEDIASKYSVKLVVLGYPHASSQSFFAALRQKGSRAEFVDLKQLLVQIENLDVGKVFEEDFLHLTDFGHQILGEKLKEVIFK